MIELGLLLLHIIMISLFFDLVRFLIDKYLSDFYQELFIKIGKLINFSKKIIRSKK